MIRQPTKVYESITLSNPAQNFKQFQLLRHSLLPLGTFVRRFDRGTYHPAPDLDKELFPILVWSFPKDNPALIQDLF